MNNNFVKDNGQMIELYDFDQSWHTKAPTIYQLNWLSAKGIDVANIHIDNRKEACDMFMSIISDDNQPTINDTIAIEKPDVFIFDKDIDNSVQIKELLETGKYKYVFFGGDSIEQYQEINDVRYLWALDLIAINQEKNMGESKFSNESITKHQFIIGVDLDSIASYLMKL